MKITNKTKRTIAAILFLLIAAVNLFKIVATITSMPKIDTQYFSTLPLLYLLGFSAIHSLVFILAGVRVLKKKKLGRIMMLFTLIAVIFTGVGSMASEAAMSTGTYTMDIKQYILPVMTLIAWVLLATSGGTTYARQGKKGEADKVAEQTEKQTSIYDQQLKDGILTKEEYDQIMKK